MFIFGPLRIATSGSGDDISAANMAGRVASNGGASPVGLAPIGHSGNLSAMSDVDFTLNGLPRRLGDPATIAALLATLGLDWRKVAVERNEAIVSRSLFDTTNLANGDHVEIVHFIGGG